jgi:hypothetical protein
MMDNVHQKRFSKRVENFTCKVCKAKVRGTGFTDHCPNCLWSMHVDVNPGDRRSECKGLMKPIKTEHNRNGFIIFYSCKKCGIKKKVHAAEEDNGELLFKLLQGLETKRGI